ncbi:dTDP-glucose 4,6-dehydratase [Muriicola marianensis]|uniref:dTDP-glucose 4,6-dehydratase n=1 Tax=Muriicola marianensis TaxID=1324801 RepID=A0ABQ1QZJ1_9FLAO|nr:dTDP-glucose 4,6-dehydratase [Muriicola marianensis]GGD49963.1 dTDP-glucose 4,6-dehydratase [Muriicola marianensis]
MSPSKKSILITGGAGFIGSSFIPYILRTHQDYHVINLDKLTYAADLARLRDIEHLDRYTFVKGDICDRKKVDQIFSEFQIDSVIHFAAESHVDNSILSPDHFIKTNIEGTFVLLESARKFWNPGFLKSKNTRFYHISTDEVFGSLGPEGHFTENSPYAPNSPYSASKASSDLLVRSYHKTYGMNTLISNCSNNFGPRQHHEKLIPTIIRKAIAEEPIPIYGDGSNIRDWIYVSDHCRAIDLVFHKGQSGDTFVIGGNNEQSNLQVAKKVCTLLDDLQPRTSGSYKELITFVKDRPGHDFRYALDDAKVRKQLGWKPLEDFESGLRKTISGYLKKIQKV